MTITSIGAPVAAFDGLTRACTKYAKTSAGLRCKKFSTARTHPVCDERLKGGGRSPGLIHKPPCKGSLARSSRGKASTHRKAARSVTRKTGAGHTHKQAIAKCKNKGFTAKGYRKCVTRVMSGGAVKAPKHSRKGKGKAAKKGRKAAKKAKRAAKKGHKPTGAHKAAINKCKNKGFTSKGYAKCVHRVMSGGAVKAPGGKKGHKAKGKKAKGKNKAKRAVGPARALVAARGIAGARAAIDAAAKAKIARAERRAAAKVKAVEKKEKKTVEAVEKKEKKVARAEKKKATKAAKK